MSPKQQERRFEPQYANILLDIADGDFRTAEFTAEGFAAGRIRPENVFFLYQQAMEKALKAVLCHIEKPVPLVDDLGVLLAKLPDDVQPEAGYIDTAEMLELETEAEIDPTAAAPDREHPRAAAPVVEEILASARSRDRTRDIGF